MEIMVYSLLWVMQELYQNYIINSRVSGLGIWDLKLQRGLRVEGEHILPESRQCIRILVQALLRVRDD